MIAPPDPSHPIVEVDDLSVRFGPDGPPVLKGISFVLNRGECLALVGESGSGKSVLSRTLVGLAGHDARVGARRLRLNGEDLTGFSEKIWRRIRGTRIGFVMQDALGSLDPLRPVGREIGEPLRLHTQLKLRERDQKAVDLLRSVGVPEAELRAAQYPHQLSGGLRQRALIASAIACNPELLIADEPTTALDTTVQAHILGLLESLRSRRAAMLVISHDLAVVARLADRVAVMREHGSMYAVLNCPRHPYTRSLLDAHAAVHARSAHLTRTHVPAPRDAEASSAGLLHRSDDFRGSNGPLLRARGLFKSFAGPGFTRRTAVSDVTFALHPGQALGIVGESGSGKTTTARIVLGLEEPDKGTVEWWGRNWRFLSHREQRAERRRVQVIFQDPLASFDPRYTVARLIHEALEVAGHDSRKTTRARAIELLNLVRLDESYLPRRPIEMSGGQRQRIAIARALAPEPEVLICDEPVSALDVSVQVQILDLLADLKERLGLACLFISHDLGVIYRVCDRVIVMKDGQVVESGAVRQVFDDPQHACTRALINAIPRIETRDRQPVSA